ncbi:MAG: lipid-A-disaccharide synthase [Alphaproteobacteria bacterium]
MKTFFLVAGEASGDFLGAQVMRSLKSMFDSPTFIGVGGPQMAAEGLESCFPYNELSIMGVLEILPQLRKLLRHIDETVALAKKTQPCAIVTIDAPGFNMRFIKRARKAGLPGPFIHYTAPQVWAWRPGRVHKIARLVDHLLCLFPFEPPYFQKVNLPTTFVGHPSIELATNKDPTFRARYMIPDTAQVLTLLPGSRVGEITRLLPIFQETARFLQARFPDLFLLIPTLPHLEAAVRKAFDGFPVPWRCLLPEDKMQGFLHAQAAIAASGTVTLELAHAGLPAVVGYRLSPLTYFFAKRMVSVQHISLVNLLLNRPLLTELVQEHCIPERLYEATVPLLEDSRKAAAIREGYGQALAMLHPEGHNRPSAAAAAVIAKVAISSSKALSGCLPLYTP